MKVSGALSTVATLVFVLAMLAAPTRVRASSPLPVGVHELAGLDFDLEGADLAPLGAIIGDADYVALGESIHTSGGYCAAKARIIRYLVAEKGFRAIAFETPRLQARTLGRFVATGEGDAVHAMAGLFGVWQDLATLELVRWLRAWNVAHPNDPVVFFGIDEQEPFDDAAALRERLGDRVPADLGLCIGTSSPKGVPKEAWPEVFGEGRHERCLAALDEMDRRIRDEVEGDTARWLQLSISGLRARQMQGWWHYQGDSVHAYEARDASMAETLMELRELMAPGARVAVWAHNAHVSADHASGMGYGPTPRRSRFPHENWRSLGTFMHDRVGDDWVAIALVGHDVEIRWAEDIAQPAAPHGRRDIESKLHHLDRAALLVGLDSPFFAAGRRYRLAHEWMVPRNQFRALVYLDHSGPMFPVPIFRMLEDDDAPERSARGLFVLHSLPRTEAAERELMALYARAFRLAGWQESEAHGDQHPSHPEWGVERAAWRKAEACASLYLFWNEEKAAWESRMVRQPCK